MLQHFTLFRRGIREAEPPWSNRIYLFRITVAVLVLLLLTACVSPRAWNWPDFLPRQQLFIAAWQADHLNQQVQSQQDYLNWVRSFYTGTVVYPRGWLDIQAELSQRAEPQLRPKLICELERLGIAIGAEWAKSNGARIIDSSMLSLWGSVLQLSQLSNQEFEAVNQISEDVSLLLEGGLRKHEIIESRYAGKLGIDTFGGF